MDKQAQTLERDPLDGLENHADWLPDSPGDSCDSLADNSPQALIARAQLASQLLQDLDDVLVKEGMYHHILFVASCSHLFHRRFLTKFRGLIYFGMLSKHFFVFFKFLISVMELIEDAQ